MKKKDESEEYVTLKVKANVKDALFEIQGLLQFRDHKRYSLSEIVGWLLENAPEIEVPMPDRLKLVEEKTKTPPQMPERT